MFSRVYVLESEIPRFQPLAHQSHISLDVLDESFARPFYGHGSGRLRHGSRGHEFRADYNAAFYAVGDEQRIAVQDFPRGVRVSFAHLDFGEKHRFFHRVRCQRLIFQKR